MPGFSFRFRPSGETPTIQSLVAGFTGQITRGDVVSLNASGQIILGVTTSTNLQGVAQETKAVTSGVTKVEVIVDADAVYGVADANARVKGAPLDLAGATGAQGVAASLNKEFVVVADKSASQETLVRFNIGKHADNKAQ